MRLLPLLAIVVGSTTFAVAEDDLPIVPEGFVVDVVAREPMVANPCVMAFDRRGRIFVGQGVQYRTPTPETPGDRVDILIDDDGDGIADRRKTFAEGFNCIQGLAWRGRDLWVANAPDLTIVRDLDGDDEADEYVRVYTGLGNLEHALHGLNFGPDGKLYMSKGNSKGYNRLDQLAPKAFREMWGLPSPAGAPDYTPLETFTKETYRRKYHTPQDDWGQQGGILRCDADGPNLEIVSLGYRNPWDIGFDDGFDWLGTDNDQTHGDKIFAPFFGSHFGWGHPWSYHWTGEGHLPTVPAAAPLFEGSGTGVVHYRATHLPAEYRDAFLVGDWLRRELYLFRPTWDGAAMKCRDGFPTTFARAGGGRSLPASSGRVFEPTDVEVGPDGAIYVLSWGHAYGATIANGKQIDAGRVYRIRHAASPLVKWKSEHRTKPLDQWSLNQLHADLVGSIPAWRTDAQDEFVRRGESVQPFLMRELADPERTKASETWTLWTLGRLGSSDIDDLLTGIVRDAKAPRNQRIQVMRILAFRIRNGIVEAPLPEVVADLLKSSDARLRHEAVQAIWQARAERFVPQLLELAANEADRVTFHSTWKALRGLVGPAERREWLADARAGVRLAALLGLFEDDAVDVDLVEPLRRDPDERVAGLVDLWLRKTGRLQPLVTMTPPPGEYTAPVTVTLATSIPGARLTYSLDGSAPVKTSTPYNGPITIDRTTTLRVAVMRSAERPGVASGTYRIRHVPAYRHRAFVTNVEPKSGRPYEIDWTGLAVGKKHYTDRDYTITSVPPELLGVPFLRTANNDDREIGSERLSFTSDSTVDVIVGVDVRVNAPLDWMRIGEEDGFVDTERVLRTTDPDFRLFEKTFPPGEIVLGGNLNVPSDSRRGNYIVIFDRQLVTPDPARKPASAAEVEAALATADPARGRELFLHPRGAGCVKCHRMEGLGPKYAPDLSDIGSRARKPSILIESILEPSKVITEGFAQQQIVTVEGKLFSGAVLEETGRSLVLVDPAGKPTTIAKDDIEERIGTKQSPMPAGFDKLLSAQQLADVVAWLGTQTSVGDRSGFSFRDRADHVDIHLGEQRIATYLKRHPQLTRRAFVNVTTASGIPVTRNFPPRKPEDVDPGYTSEDGIIHPVMHSGIWLGFGDVDGNDYWRLRAKVEFDGFVEPPTGDMDSGRFAVRNRYLSEDGTDTVCIELTRYEFERVDDGWWLRIDAEFRNDERDFYFGDQEESGLALRVASPIRVQGGNGTILNDRGERNGAGVWGKEAKWFDYFGTVDGREVGVMVVPSAANPRPSWLHARDYGVVVTNPFPKQPKERREPYVNTWVRKGEPYRLSYDVLIHDRTADSALDREAAFERVKSRAVRRTE